ncbi:carbon-nitrogen hydrolase family protein [Parapedobacter sp. DT-150]|uniref:carbon-nitrogen hydrolase family protein n=1 Tax=Parapedobacter sp. DT-150 TaxID=3396162 RepID=UPI003F1BE5C7
MKIALASPPYPKSLNDGLQWVATCTRDAAMQHADIICFPESYLPGYPLLEFEAEKCTAGQLQDALEQVRQVAAANQVAIIIPMDWHHDDKVYNVAQVISAEGELLGFQTKNQLDPSEDQQWTAGTERRIFDVKGVKFGITICHEGFRYPESVRWAATQGAKLVFHPNCTGSNIEGPHLTEWGAKGNPYYEKAQMMRAMENTIYFASSNYRFRYPDSASALIGPNGSCIAYQPYGEAGIVIGELDPDAATGLLARRFKAHLYH